MGPALSNLDDMLRMPYGCGEQNAASTVVNLPILRYLLATGQATDEIIAKAKNFLQIGKCMSNSVCQWIKMSKKENSPKNF